MVMQTHCLCKTLRASKDERGAEVFYHLAITPAVRLIPSYQHIWNPLIAGVASKQDSTDLFLVRLNIAW
jgi:porin